MGPGPGRIHLQNVNFSPNSLAPQTTRAVQNLYTFVRHRLFSRRLAANFTQLVNRKQARSGNIPRSINLEHGIPWSVFFPFEPRVSTKRIVGPCQRQLDFSASFSP